MSRRIVLVAMLAAVGLIAAPLLATPRPRLIWNASASVPIGLYRAEGADNLALGDLVAVMPPDELATFLAERGAVPRGVPILKHVAALAGSTVCRTGVTVTIDGRPAAVALLRDRAGRLLPTWSGCRTLVDGEAFLLNPDAPESFDGRYFGPLPVDAIVARLEPLWTCAPAKAASHPPPASSPHRP